MTDRPRHVLIIANPTSGRRRRADWCERVADGLRRAGVVVDLYETTQPGDARHCAAQRLADAADAGHPSDAPPQYDCIVACGGDGTIQEVASALAEHRAARLPESDVDGSAAPAAEARLGGASAPAATPALGIIPSGRCNDLARVLGLHADIETTLAALIRGCRRPLDLGRVNGRYFCTVATMGFDAAVSRYVDGLRVPLLTGTRAYLFGAARMVLTFRAPQLTIEGDFGRIEGRFVLATTANTATYGGSMPIAPSASPTDGLLDLCLIENAPRHRLVPLLARAVRGRHVGRRGVRFLRTRRFRIESADSRELWADGEWIADTPADIEIVPGAVEVMTPPGSPATPGVVAAPSQ